MITVRAWAVPEGVGAYAPEQSEGGSARDGLCVIFDFQNFISERKALDRISRALSQEAAFGLTAPPSTRLPWRWDLEEARKWLQDAGVSTHVDWMDGSCEVVPEYDFEEHELLDDIARTTSITFRVDREAVLATRMPRESEPTDSGERRFAVGLSFAGDRRDYIEKVAAKLAVTLGREKVLYDKYLEAELARPSASFYLPKLYREHAELNAVFASVPYTERGWCGLEWKAIHELIQNKECHRIILFSFGARPSLEGLGAGDITIDIENRPAAEVAGLILQRLQLERSRMADGERSANDSIPSVAGLGTSPAEVPGDQFNLRIEEAMGRFGQAAKQVEEEKGPEALGNYGRFYMAWQVEPRAQVDRLVDLDAALTSTDESLLGNPYGHPSLRPEGDWLVAQDSVNRGKLFEWACVHRTGFLFRMVAYQFDVSGDGKTERLFEYHLPFNAATWYMLLALRFAEQLHKRGEPTTQHIRYWMRFDDLKERRLYNFYGHHAMNAYQSFCHIPSWSNSIVFDADGVPGILADTVYSFVRGLYEQFDLFDLPQAETQEAIDKKIAAFLQSKKD